MGGVWADGGGGVCVVGWISGQGTGPAAGTTVCAGHATECWSHPNYPKPVPPSTAHTAHLSGGDGHEEGGWLEPLPGHQDQRLVIWGGRHAGGAVGGHTYAVLRRGRQQGRGVCSGAIRAAGEQRRCLGVWVAGTARIACNRACTCCPAGSRSSSPRSSARRRAPCRPCGSGWSSGTLQAE